MNNEEYLSEEKYQRNKKNVITIGKVLLITGIIILVASFIILFLGFTGFGNTVSNGIQSAETGSINGSQIAKDTFGNFGLFILFGLLDFIGFALTLAGGITLYFAHRREITAFTTQQVMPVAKEGIEKITPTVANAAGDIAQSISKGIQDGKKEADNK